MSSNLQTFKPRCAFRVLCKAFCKLPCAGFSDAVHTCSHLFCKLEGVKFFKMANPRETQRTIPNQPMGLGHSPDRNYFVRFGDGCVFLHLARRRPRPGPIAHCTGCRACKTDRANSFAGNSGPVGTNCQAHRARTFGQQRAGTFGERFTGRGTGGVDGDTHQSGAGCNSNYRPEKPKH